MPQIQPLKKEGRKKEIKEKILKKYSIMKIKKNIIILIKYLLLLLTAPLFENTCNLL